jgi:uncharacterized membrane protein YeiH
VGGDAGRARSVILGQGELPRVAGPLLAHTIQVLDWIGTLAFALSGGLLGVRKRFDLFGVLCLAFVAAVTGGIIRDVLIDATPPVAITQLHYFVIAMVAGVIAFYWYPQVALWKRGIKFLDAIGLALFAVIGTQKAFAYHIHPAMAAVMGMITGIGGGMLRDLLAGERPFVLRSDLYAVAALVGSAVVAAGHVVDGPPTLFTLLGAAACIYLRLMAIFRGWHAPLPRTQPDEGP